MTREPDTSVIARILATGYDRHVRDHGPDADHAGEATETADGHGFIISRGGAPYAVRVERAQAMAEPGPLTPGQCWAALKRDVGTALAAHQAIVDNGPAEASSPSFVNAYAYVLQRMQALEASQ
jgi:hypothetical protein